ncbi:MAG: DUF4301 family protein [Muribaculaceae bacterium]|nr:DUF4301 family protein [Muribaculaceae bacterium]
MFTEKDLKDFESKGISLATIEGQLNRFKTGFPYLKVVSAASIGNGVVSLTTGEEMECVYAWDDYLHSGGSVEKFVPASGAASRMFKNLFEFLASGRQEPETSFEKKFFSEIKNFAFYHELNAVCLKRAGMGIEDLMSDGLYSEVVRLLLSEEGLNYGNLPKGVLKFHKSEDAVHTAIEEHMEEGAQYATDANNNVDIHFTVSPEHRELFNRVFLSSRNKMEMEYGVHYSISMSEQKSSTDTIAVNLDNTPFRESDDTILFRPAGHGALIENLNERSANVIFIKNIDNIVPATKREITVKYKKILGGYLILLQKRISKYLGLLKSGQYTIDDLREMIHFVHDKLCLRYSETKHLDDSELAVYLQSKFNRPIRVCGVVKNDGEPGGGPFIAYNADGSTSLQIMESSQFDLTDRQSCELMNKATHFNPVDLVCYIKDDKGNKFNLSDYVDNETGFISMKSKNGKDLKALELPGLWNGAMSDWNTVFIEVPIETFNPVKTVNDLLRDMHQ